MTCVAPAACNAAFEDGEFVIRQGRKNSIYYPPAKMAFKRTVTGDKLANGGAVLRSGFDDMVKKPEATKADSPEVKKVEPIERAPCPSGPDCYISAEAHRARFAHRGDWDYKPPALMSGGKRRTEDHEISHKADWHLFGKQADCQALWIRPGAPAGPGRALQGR
mmetsp:Transcript_5171/g.11400  ORF Transcript_5171/g.11400 Transcript_5171/m.11400 type:complete len:164 (-) Transcript_5171:339-830(-)